MELKLRVFADGKMTYLDRVRIDGCDDVKKEIKVTFEETDDEFHDDFANATPKNPVLMHTTGLKDMDGKNLYFDDLIIFYYGNYKDDLIWDVRDMDDIEYILNSKNERGGRFEIIGNAHENPDLLKD